ncbi:Bug family tripartite tricarboxylate transporter substrate binding protein [Ottowia thiooxydans]|uniref:Tripartite-type tricarboxylate transporter receptor subunit TctC n=1 Tax=Ottowia thiooxydans TaxID=219182 RepID=A0ABV2Q4A5_9BURK
MKKISLLAAVAMAWSSTAIAQNYPVKPIRLIVPFAPGQGADAAARIVAQKLSDNLKQPLVIDNRPGAGGVIGTEAVAKAPADGYTLLVGSNGTHAANPSLYATLPYNALEDFEPIAYIGSVAMVLVSAPNHEAKTPKEVFSAAKAQPGTVSVAIPSSTSRVVLEMLTKASGAKFNPIGYKASGTATTDLMGGHVMLSIDTVIATAPNISSGKLRGIAVTTAKRTSSLPNVPTFQEAGMREIDIAAWNAWFAPRGTPSEVIEKLNGELRRVLGDPDTQTRLRALGYEPDGKLAPAQVRDFVRKEEKKWGDLIRSGGIKAE